MQSQTSKEVPLHRLRPGHEFPGADINMRKTYSTAETQEMAESIRAEGVLQSLLCCAAPDTAFEDRLLYVSAGGRRLAGMLLLLQAGHIDGDYLVPIILRDAATPGDALAWSMLENDARIPPHAVDRFEAFSNLIAMGADETAVAERFHTTARVVKQNLKLGRIAPPIRAAWREGLITREIAELFTLAPDLDVQEKIFEQLKAQDRLWANSVEDAVRGDAEHVAIHLSLVGIDSYVKAGGEVIEDLFHEDHIVSDVPLLKAMVNDCLDRECQRLIGAGWAWAKPETAMPRDWKQWRRSEPKLVYTDDEKERLEKLNAIADELEALDEISDEQEETLHNAHALIHALNQIVTERGFSDRAKKKAGCIVDAADGRFVITFGFIRPADEIPDTTAPAQSERPDREAEQAEPKKSANLSDALAQRMSLALTRAASSALAEQPDLALAVVLAAFASNAGAGPVRISHGGLGSHDLNLSDGKSFEANLKRFAHRTADENVATLAHVAAAALNFEKADAKHHALTVPSVAALCAAIPGVADAVTQAWDAEDYFSNAPQVFGLKAIQEALGGEYADAMAKKGKAEIVRFCLANVVPTGWLPPELRVAGYTAPEPGAKSAKARKPAKAKAKAPAKKKAAKAKAKGKRK